MCSVGVLPRLFFLYATLLITFFSRTRGPGAYGTSHITHSSDYNKDLLISHPQGRFIHSLKLAVSEVVGKYDWSIWHGFHNTLIVFRVFLSFFDVFWCHFFPLLFFLPCTTNLRRIYLWTKKRVIASLMKKIINKPTRTSYSHFGLWSTQTKQFVHASETAQWS